MTEEVPAARSHILTVVLEDYFQVGAFSHLIPNGYWGRFETNLQHDAETALELLAETGSTATFFTCGWIADNHPQILRRIVENGHEVACQGYFHHRIGEQKPADFAADVRRSRFAVEDATGCKVEGFRIGRGWIGHKDLWALDVLAEQDFIYDSSMRATGLDPLRDVLHRYEGAGGGLYEVPASGVSLPGRQLLLSGGNYLRQFPDWLLRRGVEKWVENHGDPLVLYFHSWELRPDQPKIAAAGFIQRLRHYRNLEAMSGKIRGYLDRYDFTSVAGHLGLSSEIAPPRPVVQSVENDVEDAEPATIVQRVRRLPLTLVIPCYNEAESLPYLKKTLERFASRSEGLFELHYILVDDGSSDETWELLQSYFGERARFCLIRHEANRGIAAALLTGFRQVRTEYLAALDADCTFAPDQLIEMASLMTDDVDVVVASPAHEQGAMHAVPVWRSMLSLGSALLYRCVLNHKLTSYTSCFRLYRRRSLEGLTLYHSDFCGVTEILGRLDLAGYRIVEYPAVLETRLLGRSKIRILRTIAGHLRLIARLAAWRWLGRPLPSQSADAGAAELQISYADTDDGR